MKFIFFWLIFTFTLFSVVGCGGKNSSPNSGRGGTASGNDNNNDGTSGTGEVTPPHRHHGSDTTSEGVSADQVHIFKYTGRLACGVGGMHLDDMESQLTGITVYNKYESTDGKDYSGKCDTTIGEINVYAISKSHLIKSEKRGFCECTPDPQNSVCTPYNYRSPPASGCR